MTDTKTPVRRTARTQPAKTTSSTARAPAGVAKVANPKPEAAKAKPAAAKPAAKPVAKPAVAARPKVTTAKVAAPKPVVVAPPVAATPKARTQPKGDTFKMRMLVDQVVKATGTKKKGVKDVVEATLSRIGEALARGDELNLPGFGKVRVVKSDAKDGTAIMTLKLRQGASKAGQKGLAATGDDD